MRTQRKARSRWEVSALARVCAFSVALLSFGSAAAEAASTDSPWRKTWHGDAGLSARVPSECGLPANSVVRLYGDTWSKKIPNVSNFSEILNLAGPLKLGTLKQGTPWSIKFGTNIVIDDVESNRRIDPAILSVPGFDAKSASIWSQLFVNRYFQGDRAPTPTLAKEQIFWPGVPFFGLSKDGRMCQLTFYGPVANAEFGTGNTDSAGRHLKLNIDVREIFRIKTTAASLALAASTMTSSVLADRSNNWTFGAAYNSLSDLDYLIRKYSARDPENNQSTAIYLQYGRPQLLDGSVQRAGRWKLPEGSLADVSSRGSVLTTSSGQSYLLASPKGFNTILYALPLPSEAPSQATLDVRPKPQAFKLLSTAEIGKLTGCSWFYDPVVHPSLIDGSGSAPLTMSASPSLSDTSKDQNNGKPDCGNKGYGNFEYRGFWPKILATSLVKKAAEGAGFPLPIQSRRVQAAGASSQSDHLTINLWPGKLQSELDTELTGIPSGVSPPNFSENPAWDVSCTFLVPNSSAEYAVQQRAAAAAQAAYIAARESWNGKRIVDSAQSAFDKAEQAYLATPTRANLDRKIVAATRLREATAMWGRIASAYDTRQAASLRAQLAACGQGRTSWTG